MIRGVTAHEDEASTSHETYQDPGEALRGRSTPPQHTDAPQGARRATDHAGHEEARRGPGGPAAGMALAAVRVLLIDSVTRRCVTVFGSRSSGGLMSRVSMSTGPCTWRVATTASPVSTVPLAFVSLTRVACTVCTLVASPCCFVRAMVPCERRTRSVVVPRRTWSTG